VLADVELGQACLAGVGGEVDCRLRAVVDNEGVLVAEVLALIGPVAKERRRAAQRPPPSAGSVAHAMRWRGR
jgi:hypothetical protein